jgi:uncharacterized iron-regulated protein
MPCVAAVGIATIKCGLFREIPVLRKYLLLIILIGMMTEVMSQEKSPDPVVDLSTMTDLSSLVEKLANKQVVFVGESHDQYQHHLNQLAIIKGLYAKHSDLVIGLEFFFQPYQPILDQYISGEIDETEMIRQTDYFNRWRFDYRLYRPILRFAREKGIPLIALNLESEITSQVGQGGIESLPEELKMRLPSQIDRDNEAYRSRLQEVFDSHPHRDGGDFERFLDVQLLWDEGMAQQAADWMQVHPDSHLVILAGVGHLMYRNGIPDRLLRRLPVSQAIVLNTNTLELLNRDLADYVVLATEQTLPPSGKMGILLDAEGSPLSISGFTKESGGAEAGLKKKDRLISIDDQPIASYTDLRIVLMDKAVGDTIKVEIERNRLFFGPIVKTYQVTLH